MRTYRYKVQTNTFGLFLGIAAETLRPQEPPIARLRVSDRVWLDTSRISDAFRHQPLSLTGQEVDSLILGLGKVADDIEQTEAARHILIAVRALEIVEADYAEAALAPAIAGWAAEEFKLTPRQVHARRDTATGHVLFDWNQ